MSLVEIHTGLASTASLFVGILALWALYLGIRNRSWDGAWLGAAIIGELLLVAQGLVGGYLYLTGLGAALPRPFLHILYGITAIITLPAAYTYLGGMENNRARSLGMALVCAILWGFLQRATQVAYVWLS
jgi:heme A synthase